MRPLLSGLPQRRSSRRVHSSVGSRVLLIGGALLLAACEGKPKADPAADSAAARAAAEARADSLDAVALVTADTAIAPTLGAKLGVSIAAMRKSPSGMLMMDKRVGSGAAADSNKWVMVDYTTWLTDGSVVDDTRAKREPRKVLLGHKQVVAAWEEGVRGMKEGGRRVLIAPASLAYGKAGKPGTVPRLATLVFDIELKKVY